MGIFGRIDTFITWFDGVVWGLPLIILILVTGIFLTVRLGLLQVRYLGAVFDSDVFDSKRVTIPAYKFSAQKARILLMLALSCTKNHETIKSFFQEY